MQASPDVPALRFRAIGAQPSRAFATPTIELWVEIGCEVPTEIRAIALNVEVRIAAQRRRYETPERERLFDLFGDPSQWQQSLGSVRWLRSSINVGSFAGSTVIEVPLPCTYDFEVAAAKYLAALQDGEIPVDVLFSGTVFYHDGAGRLQSAMIPWESEATLRIPVAMWRRAIDAAFPDSAWLRLNRATLARLQAYRSNHAHLDWDETLADLLASDRG